MNKTMRDRVSSRVCLMGLIVGLQAICGMAYAQEASASGGKPHGAMSACRPDVQKLCPGMKPGDGKLRACMREHISEVSPSCSAAIASMHHKKGRAAAPPAQ